MATTSTSESTPDADAVSSVTSGSDNEDLAANEEEVTNVKKLFTETKVSGGKSAWATTLETFGMSDGGKKKKGDIVCATFNEAMEVFHDLTNDKKWEFAYTPFDDFQATREDLLQAFVHWSRKSSDDDDNKNYNPSKAFRRLEAYVDWMDKNCPNVNLKGITMKAVADVWKMQMTHDKAGRLVWWIDVGGIDLKHIKKNLSNDDTLRYFVWLSHLVLFDKGSQEHGFVIVEGMGYAGMMECMTAVSMDVGTKLDRLTIGILPLKMQACYLFNNPTWMKIIAALMAPFMGKKMRQRIQALPNKKDPQAFFEEVIGKEHIPKTGVAQLEGMVEKDIVEATFERLLSGGTAGSEEISQEVDV